MSHIVLYGPATREPQPLEWVVGYWPHMRQFKRQSLLHGGWYLCRKGPWGWTMRNKTGAWRMRPPSAPEFWTPILQPKSERTGA
jgi:hypothetical protein